MSLEKDSIPVGNNLNNSSLDSHNLSKDSSVEEETSATSLDPDLLGNSKIKSSYDVESDLKEPKLLDKYFIDENFLQESELNTSEENKKTLQQKALIYKENGNAKFKEEAYEEAACLYTEGLRICPLSFKKDRAILYSNRAAARSKLNQEQKEASIDDCDKAISLDPSYLRAIQRRATLHHELDHLEEALKDLEMLLQFDPGNRDARNKVQVLKLEIEEKNEKLKNEMLGKLKDLGNMVLKPFGLSTDNFQLNENPETKGYNISFNQNPS